MWTLGIESTAHTLSFGLIDKNGIPFPSSTSTIKPEKGGIHPREAADHHKAAASGLLSAALNSQSLSPDDIGAIALLTSPVNTTRNADPRAKKSHASCIRAHNA